MKNTMNLARANPDLTLPEMHKLTTDQQNLIEFTCAAQVLVSQLDVVAIPEDLQESRDRLRRAVRLIDINPNAKES